MKMKKLLFIPIVLCLLLGFTINKHIAPESNSLKGTWVMTSEKHGNDPVAKPKDGIIKRKYLTETHFSWVEYDVKGHVIQLGGGSYTLHNNQYSEVIEYFYPKGSGLLGASIPFKCELDGKKWTHKGVIQYREIDGETGEYAIVNSEPLEEVWEKVD